MSDAGDLALMMSAPDGAKMNRLLTGVMSKSFGAMPALVGIMQRYKCDNLLASQSRYVLLAGEMAGVCVSLALGTPPPAPAAQLLLGLHQARLNPGTHGSIAADPVAVE